MTDSPVGAERYLTLVPETAKPTTKQLFEAVGDLALAIKPHHMDFNERQRIRDALHVLVDAIITHRQPISQTKPQSREQTE